MKRVLDGSMNAFEGNSFLTRHKWTHNNYRVIWKWKEVDLIVTIIYRKKAYAYHAGFHVEFGDTGSLANHEGKGHLVERPVGDLVKTVHYQQLLGTACVNHFEYLNILEKIFNI